MLSHSTLVPSFPIFPFPHSIPIHTTPRLGHKNTMYDDNPFSGRIEKEFTGSLASGLYKQLLPAPPPGLFTSELLSSSSGCVVFL